MVHESIGRNDAGGILEAASGGEKPRRLWNRRHTVWTLVNCVIAVPLTCIVGEFTEPPHQYFWYAVIFCAVLLMPWISWEDKED